MTTYNVGQKVRILINVYELPKGGCLARKGEVLVVRSLSAIDPHTVYVSHEHEHGESFGVNDDEIEAVK